MSHFRNRSSRERAEASLNKLVSSIMPSSGCVTSVHNRKEDGHQKHNITSIQSLNEAFNNMDSRTKNNRDGVIEKKMRKLKKKQIKKNKRIEEEVEKVAKLQIIKRQVEEAKKKSESDGSTRYEKPQYQLSSDEKKFMNQLISENVKKLKLYSGQANESQGDSLSSDEGAEDAIQDEIRQLQEDILAIKNKNSKKNAVKNARQGQQRKRQLEFSSEKIVNGKKIRVHAYPGLTPGLAPVDLEDDEDSE